MSLGEIRRGLAVIAGGVRIGAVGQEKIDHLIIAKLRRGVQRGVAELLPRIRIRPAREQKTHRAGIANRRRGMNRRYAKGIARRRVHIRATLDQCTRQLGVAKEDRQSDRRKPILRILIEQRRIGVEHPQRQRFITESAGLAERQRSAMIEEQPRQLRMPVVNGKQNRRDAVLPRIDQRRIAIEQRDDRRSVVASDGFEQGLLCDIGRSTPRRAILSAKVTPTV